MSFLGNNAFPVYRIVSDWIEEIIDFTGKWRRIPSDEEHSWVNMETGDIGIFSEFQDKEEDLLAELKQNVLGKHCILISRNVLKSTQSIFIIRVDEISSGNLWIVLKSKDPILSFIRRNRKTEYNTYMERFSPYPHPNFSDFDDGYSRLLLDKEESIELLTIDEENRDTCEVLRQLNNFGFFAFCYDSIFSKDAENWEYVF